MEEDPYGGVNLPWRRIPTGGYLAVKEEPYRGGTCCEGGPYRAAQVYLQQGVANEATFLYPKKVLLG